MSSNVFEKIYTESDGLRMDDRFKAYESKLTGVRVSNEYPIIMRFDGHKFTKSCKKLKTESPFNKKFDTSMLLSCEKLKEFSKADLALVGSDEISLIFKPRLGKNGEYVEAPWGGRVLKMATLFSSYLSVVFQSVNQVGFEFPIFDARVFNIPEFEVLNYIMSRQISFGTNAVSQYADYYIGKKSTVGMNSDQKIQMLKDKGIDYEFLCPNHVKYGTLMGLGERLSMKFRRSEMDEELIKKIEYKY